ncbi:branched-chain amino acid ABC transporter permease [Mesorhizobium sp. B4-1-1]|uniref:branched-chain amino acid ABC transporter permease n=1 Tax=Mesorhizobium sp. B4-1-1 TaxID=2589890 RepID=UPI0011267687|nr:branched-chain amino acid ABC transporter permease [Mesorhizobium sp. B4-1-1]TPI15573.1 branched-chain amino acid ABC transporter permease [Mesorhizobium sp. B4-1-1]
MTRPARLGLGLTMLAWAGLALAPLVLDDWNIGQLTQYVTYGIFALSLGLIWGQAGILCFGQAIFFGVGAYSMALVTLGKLSWLGDSQWTGIALALLLPMLVAAVLGWILFQGRALSGAHLAIVTLCAAVVCEIAARRWEFIGGFNGLFGVPPLSWPNGDPLSTNATYFFIGGAALLAYLLSLWIGRSPLGTVLAGIRNDERRTLHFGYDVRLHKIFVFTVSGAMAGLAGGLFTTQFGFVSPPLVGFALSTEVLIWVAVGGRSVLMGAFLGALAVRGTENAMSASLDQYWLIALGALFIVVVVVLPQGLFGKLLALAPPRRLHQGGAK